jgi:hypothetical protein
VQEDKESAADFSEAWHATTANQEGARMLRKCSHNSFRAWAFMLERSISSYLRKFWLLAVAGLVLFGHCSTSSVLV